MRVLLVSGCFEEVVMTVCDKCFISVSNEMLEYHAVDVHGVKPSEAYVEPAWHNQKHLYTDMVHVFGEARDSYGD